jgi:hypothetical protein
MKITGSEVIKSGERELIDGITAELDWGVIEEIFKNEHKLGIKEDVEYKSGDIIVHNNQITYKLEFEIKVALSVLLDRNGNYISVDSPELLDITGGNTEIGHDDDVAKTEDEHQEKVEELDPNDQPDAESIDSSISSPAQPHEKISQMASQAGEVMEKLREEE